MYTDPRRSLPLLVLSKAEASKDEWAGMTKKAFVMFA
jgi:hypothetical protein